MTTWALALPAAKARAAHAARHVFFRDIRMDQPLKKVVDVGGHTQDASNGTLATTASG